MTRSYAVSVKVSSPPRITMSLSGQCYIVKSRGGCDHKKSVVFISKDNMFNHSANGVTNNEMAFLNMGS